MRRKILTLHLLYLVCDCSQHFYVLLRVFASVCILHSPFLQHLADTYFGVRNKCLQLLGCLGFVDKPLSKESEGVAAGTTPRDVQGIISDYFEDQDPRVRTAAIKAMV